MWPAASVLLDYITRGDGEEYVRRNARVLELGAGLGWLAMRLLDVRSDIEILVTEATEGDAAARLQRNVRGWLHRRACASASACASSPPEISVPRLRAETLDWSLTSSSALFNSRWDVILGSDLVYSVAGADALCRAIDDALSRASHTSPPVVLYAHTCGRWGGHGYDATLLAALVRWRLSAVPVGGETLLRDAVTRRQHVVVFEVKRQHATEEEKEEEEDGTAVLLRASRLHRQDELAAEAAMTGEERDAASAGVWFASLGSA